MNTSTIKDGKLTEKGKQTEKELLEKYPPGPERDRRVSRNLGGGISLVGKGSDPEAKIDVQKLRRNRAKKE